MWLLHIQKNLKVLRCKKAKECQCPWKLRAMVVKDIFFFAINKYKGPHTCVNPCLNRDHQQSNSNLVADHIKAMIKTRFTLSVAAIQATIMEKFGYEISNKKALVGKHKTLTNLFGDFHKSYAELPRFFIALEQTNPGCVVTWKTFDSHMQNTSIEGFNHCRLIPSIDGTHFHGKNKCTLMIVMGCDGNNQLFPLTFAITKRENIDSWGWFLTYIRNKVTQWMRLFVIYDKHLGIMTTMTNVYFGWIELYAYHRICMRHLARNFMNRFKYKI